MTVSVGWVFRRLLLYVGLAFAGLAIIAVLVFIGAATGKNDSIQAWLLPTLWTGCLCFVALKVFSADWRRPMFWLVLTLLVAAQILALRPIVRHFPHLHSATYMLAILAEGPVWAVLIEGVLALTYGSKEHRRHAPKAPAHGSC